MGFCSQLIISQYCWVLVFRFYPWHDSQKQKKILSATVTQSCLSLCSLLFLMPSGRIERRAKMTLSILFFFFFWPCWKRCFHFKKWGYFRCYQTSYFSFRGPPSENCIVFYFIISKNYFINYNISFYNILNILIFIL